ncbi:hypothetical protein [Undibacterium fentianense]|uniref:Uncharacterized protein n=1 Tax=Undibacterium fentianense TaxID=2828728 RepID=A0A941E2N0_9BURK|nr:hypothetical protein [Undibacterium fentianense]MBR7798568.1 hypothetical protein [Undibacterium fentianense]
MQITIYDKTDKGREEIATRQWHLASRMRSLLVLIDGKKTDADIVQKISGLGLDWQSLQHLQDDGFIQRVSIETHQVDTLLDTSSNDLDLTDDTSRNRSEHLASNTLGSIDALAESQTIFEPSEDADSSWNQDIDALLARFDEDKTESRVDMMKRYLAELIKENLGLKGFFLQRKLLKVQTLDDLHAFRQVYVAAILHAKGKDKAIELRDQFDMRVYVRFSLDDPQFLEN